MEVMISELYKGNFDGMKAVALAHRDKFLNEKSRQLKRKWKLDTLVVSICAVLGQVIPGSGIAVESAYFKKKEKKYAKKLGCHEAVGGEDASNFIEETWNEILEQLVLELIPGSSLVLVGVHWTSFREKMIKMIDILHEKAKIYHHDAIEKCHERIMNDQKRH
jgi:hypothetical protein